MLLLSLELDECYDKRANCRYAVGSGPVIALGWNSLHHVHMIAHLHHPLGMDVRQKTDDKKP